MTVEVTLNAGDPNSAVVLSTDDWLADFQLLAELGEGGHGRVYLAQQSSLANRPVVLKISPRRGREHISLARLQHTNIVPLYWVHEDERNDQRTLCMPYFGRLTLAGLLHELRDIPPAQRTGADIVAALDRTRLDAAGDAHGARPIRQFLERTTYVRAVCWLTACLADALHYAHERGLMHLDLKPSNVLIASDGQPMLLDFHLAREPVGSADNVGRSIGGTPAYMSPEQRQLISDLRAARETVVAVDRRSDIYSLGLMIHYSLGGPEPAANGAAHGDSPPRLEKYNRAVSCGLGDIVAKCLAVKPENRYSDAAALATDLRQHLANLPLRGVPNRSLSERLLKLHRRRPHLSVLAGLGTLLAVVIFLATWFIRSYQATTADERAARLQNTLVMARSHAQHGRHAEALGAFSAALSLAESHGAPGTNNIAGELRQARQAKLRHDLHELVERIRFAAVMDALTPAAVVELDRSCRALWDARSQVTATDAVTDFLDLAIISADLRVRLGAEDSLTAHREALAILCDAEREYGRSAILWKQKARHLHALGDVAAADAAEATAGKLQAQTCWEYCAIGRLHMNAAELSAAVQQFENAINADPAAFWPHFYLGVCRYRLGRYQAAESAFLTCIALQPDSPAAWYNRALAQVRQGLLEQARHSYERVRRLDRHFDAALLRHLEELLHSIDVRRNG